MVGLAVGQATNISVQQYQIFAVGRRPDGGVQ